MPITKNKAKPSVASSVPVGERVFLPFEGDQTLSVIISKAFLLANDKAIKDPSITRQLGK
jgi:hypothetical protein